MRDEKIRRGWPVVLAVTVVFALPAAVGGLLFRSGWKPAAAVHGTLVRPPLKVAGDFGGRWTLLYFGSGTCSADCRLALAKMGRVQLALGRDRDRVQRVLAIRGAEPAAAALSPGVAVVAGEEMAWARDGKTYLIDPLGNLVLAYDAEADPGGIRRDLARLLAYSWVG